MKVIFLKEVPKIAKAGDVRTVKDGYARNFLIPHGLAAAATDENLEQQEGIKARAAAGQERDEKAMRALSERLQATPLTFTLKVGAKGQAFGSVTAENIADELAKQGVHIDTAWLELEHGLKTTGEHVIPVKLPHHITGAVTLTIEAET